MPSESACVRQPEWLSLGLLPGSVAPLLLALDRIQAPDLAALPGTDLLLSRGVCRRSSSWLLSEKPKGLLRGRIKDPRRSGMLQAVRR